MIERNTALTPFFLFRVASNNFKGTIPTEYGKLTNLHFLSLSSNSLTGNLPTELSNLQKLEALRVHWNDLSGVIPPEFSTMSRLKMIHVEGNNFTGGLDESFCSIPDGKFEAFMSDCAWNKDDANAIATKKVNCTCCTHCCYDGGNCRPSSWFQV